MSLIFDIKFEFDLKKVLCGERREFLEKVSGFCKKRLTEMRPSKRRKKADANESIRNS